MTRLAFTSLLALAVLAGAYTASRAQTHCTTTAFQGTTMTRCSDGSSATSSSFGSTTSTTIHPAPMLPIQPMLPVPIQPFQGGATCYDATFQGMVRRPC